MNFSSSEINLNSQAKFGLEKVFNRVSKNLARDSLVQEVTSKLRNSLQVDRVVLYYFYRQWNGQVTFESLRTPALSILGMTGADDCFNDEYAAMYLEGRTKAIENVDLAPIHECHRDFLKSIKVKANLVVPVLKSKGLWGLLVAHHCQSPRTWTEMDVQVMKKGAQTLSSSPSIRI